MASSESGSGRRILVLALVMFLSLAIAAYTASAFPLLDFSGRSHYSIWSDRELVLCASSLALAVLVGVAARRAQAGPAAPGGVAARFVLWLGLSLFVCAAWWSAGLFYAPFVAPAHAFGVIRLFNAWQQWRTALQAKRFR